MSLSVKGIRHEDFLEVVVTGEYDLREAIDNFRSVLIPCYLTGISKVLIDFRKLSGEISAIEKIIYALEVQGKYFEHLASSGQKLVVAYVGRAPLVSTYKPGMKIAMESDMPINLFTSIEDAYEWLCISTS